MATEEIARPRRATDETETAISSLLINVRQLSEELAAERSARQQDKEKGVSVLRLHVPFIMWFATVGGLIGGGIPVGLFVNSVKAHLADKAAHVDVARADAQGGLVYRKDFEAAVSNVEADDRRALRVLVKSSPLRCEPPTGVQGHKTARCDFKESESPTR